VVDAFAFKPDALTNVASPATLDRIVRNTLAIQLGDKALAAEVYDDLRTQVVRANERWHDVNVSIVLTPWAAGPASGTGAMFVATVRWEYRAVPSSSILRFACVSDLDEYRELGLGPTSTGMWYFEPVAGLDGASAEAFELVEVTVNGKARPLRRTTRAGSQIYTVSVGKDPDGGQSEAVISQHLPCLGPTARAPAAPGHRATVEGTQGPVLVRRLWDPLRQRAGLHQQLTAGPDLTDASIGANAAC